MEVSSNPGAPSHLRTWWNALVRPESAGRLVLGIEARPGFDRFLIVSLALAYFAYGFGMGIFRGFYPAVVSALKLPFLYILTLAVCVPSLYVLNCLLGPRLGARACLRLLLLARPFQFRPHLSEVATVLDPGIV